MMADLDRIRLIKTCLALRATHTAKEIAGRLGVSRRVVLGLWQRAINKGLLSRKVRPARKPKQTAHGPGRPPRRFDHDEARRLVESKTITPAEAARRYGVSATSIRQVTEIDPDDEEFQLTQRKRATLLHLLDLKRAGYSPTMTELTIPSRVEFRVALPRTSYAHPQSLTGSFALMCEEG